jgi:hypothetical protein
MPAIQPRIRRLSAPLIHIDVFAALVVLVVAYSLVDPQLRFGARWLLSIIMLSLLIPIVASRRMGRHDVARLIGFFSHGVATCAVAWSVAVLGWRVVGGDVTPGNLLRDAGLLWVANVVAFSLWYWQLDGGGPSERHIHGYSPTDFAFPQTSLGGKFAENWTPGYVDYLFISSFRSTPAPLSVQPTP